MIKRVKDLIERMMVPVVDDELKQRQLSELARQLAKMAEQEQLWHEARAALQTVEGERELKRRELARLRGEALRVAGMQQTAADTQEVETECTPVVVVPDLVGGHPVPGAPGAGGEKVVNSGRGGPAPSAEL